MKAIPFGSRVLGTSFGPKTTSSGRSIPLTIALALWAGVEILPRLNVDFGDGEGVFRGSGADSVGHLRSPFFYSEFNFRKEDFISKGGLFLGGEGNLLLKRP